MSDFSSLLGADLGPGPWLTVDQARIQAFAEATGDHQWIHTDPARAAAELPGGTTVAHGFLTLSLLPALTAGLLPPAGSRAINYGLNRVRFTAPVPAGARLRARLRLLAVEPVPGGHRLTLQATVEMDGSARPVLVAETLRLVLG